MGSSFHWEENTRPRYTTRARTARDMIRAEIMCLGIFFIPTSLYQQ